MVNHLPKENVLKVLVKIVNCLINQSNDDHNLTSVTGLKTSKLTQNVMNSNQSLLGLSRFHTATF